MKKAHLVRVLPLREEAIAIAPHTASLYRLEPPMKLSWATYDHVVVLAEDNRYGGTTCLYGADADANILSPGDLPGSFDGGMDHVKALEGAGYEVVLGDCSVPQ